MKHTRVKKAVLKAKSEELKIPFANLLAGYVLEELMYMIEDSPFSRVLLLKNGDIFGVGQYSGGSQLSLEFAYVQDKKLMEGTGFAPGAPFSLKLAYIMLAHFMRREKVPEIRWRGRTSVTEKEIFMYITGEFAEMTVPVRIHIDLFEGECDSYEKRSFSSFLCAGEKIEYLSYPADMLLAETLYEILNEMELIPDMEPYSRVYHTLKEQIIHGRSIKEELSHCLKEKEMEPERGRVDEILAYCSYGYMKKRWEKYVRHKKEKEVSWEELLKVLGDFLSPVWKSLCEDEVFLGDWMPELGRFL